MVSREETSKKLEEVKKNIELGEPKRIMNDNIRCWNYFYITPKALDEWAEKYLKGRNLSKRQELEAFKQKNLLRFQNIFLLTLKIITIKFGIFPSPGNPTKNVYILFSNQGSIASCDDLTDNFDTLLVQFNVLHIDLKDRDFRNFFKHELLHLFSEERHEEAEVIRILKVLQKRRTLEIESYRAVLENRIKDLLNHLEKLTLEGKPEKTDILTSIEYFYRYSVGKFWNLVCDSALCVIAIELDDKDFINFWVEQDGEIVRLLKERLVKIKKAKVFIESNEENQGRREYLLHSIKVLEFIECYNGMPFFAVAYSILGRGWKQNTKKLLWRIFRKHWHANNASRNIYDFESAIREYCDPDVAEGFLRFYNDYLHIIEAQYIGNNPLDPNIERQIHNIESNNRAEKAYLTLNTEFGKLLRQLK